MFEQILAERITQLDNLYSIAKDLRSKSLILSQMVALAKKIDENIFQGLKLRFLDKGIIKPKIVEESNIDEIIRQLIRFAHYSSKIYFEKSDSWETDKITETIGVLAVYMDQIRAKLLVELIERGLIKSFREIPIGVKEILESEEYGVSIE